ncbi:MAG: hypothetical protein WCV81_02685 [Microgenomates group bacterium]|jgi:hypothetical protein
MSKLDIEPTLPNDCLTLPPVCQEGVLKVLTTLNEITEKKLWFKPRTLAEIDTILPNINELAQKINKSLRDYANFEDAYGASYKEASKRGRSGARDAAFSVASDKAFFAALEAASRSDIGAGWRPRMAPDQNEDMDPTTSAAWNANHIAGRCAAGEVIKDNNQFADNPFSHCLELYRLGATEIALKQVYEPPKRTECLILHFPLILPGQKTFVLASLAYPKDGTPR